RRLVEAVVPARRPGRRPLGVRADLVHQDRESQQAGTCADHQPVVERTARRRQLQVPPAAEPAAALNGRRARMAMHIGLVGLGKMGFNMRDRLRQKGVEVTGYDPNPAVTDVKTLAEMVAALPTPRVVWVMVP